MTATRSSTTSVVDDGAVPSEETIVVVAGAIAGLAAVVPLRCGGANGETDSGGDDGTTNRRLITMHD